ncbi:MAG TPA: hypothetical protein VMU80_22080 [Bryobacteraceae bacterium]|nr:hypothetical protein [Bryobacteraceae bacterium]
MRTLWLSAIVLLCSIAAWAGDNPAVGKWNCSSVAENGARLDWSLAVKDDGGQLAAVVTMDGTDMPLNETKLDGNTLTFKLRVNDHEVVSFELHIAGDQLNGRFEGHEAGRATITGTRAE